MLKSVTFIFNYEYMFIEGYEIFLIEQILMMYYQTGFRYLTSFI